ncbi:MAG: polyprenyl synthetase family protein, partial [Myxococcota bacterium]
SFDASELSAVCALGPTVFRLGDGELGELARVRRIWELSGSYEPIARDLLEYRAAVVDTVSRLIEHLAAPERLRQLLRRAFDEVVSWAVMAPCVPAIDFPAAVAACAGEDMNAANPVSVASLLYYLGISLIDDVIDDEVDRSWGARRTEELILAGMCSYAGLPMEALQSLYGHHGNDHDYRDDRIDACYSLFERARYYMAVGQYLDIGSELTVHTTFDDCKSIIELKTGSTGELAAVLMATIMDLPGTRIDHLARACKYLNMSMQLAGDIHDVYGRPVSADLANGTVTLLTLYTFHAADEVMRRSFAAVLRSADWTESGQIAVRAHLDASGALTFALLEAEAMRRRAMAAWTESACEPGGILLFDYMFEAARIIR